MTKDKQIFIILSRVPYPLEKGDKLRAYHQIKELSKENKVALCCLSDQKVSKETIEHLEDITDELHILYLNKWLIYWNVFKMFFHSKPFQVGYFLQRRLKIKVQQIINAFDPDTIYCQLLRVAEYVKDIHNVPKTIDYMDAFSKGMLRRAEISKGFKKYLFNLEGQRLRVYENKIFDYFDYHIIISEQDKDFIGHSANQNIKVIENGIDESFFNFKTNVEVKFDVVFVGNLNYAPNISSCLYLINNLYPKLIKLKQQARVLLAGANPNDKILAAVRSNSNIEVSGWVEDIRESYLAGKVFVAPLFIGTGLQNKLLEAMALGVPCITTTLANNALGAIPDQDILIANSEEEFVESIGRLLNDHELYDQIKNNAKNFVLDQFNWRKSTARIPL